MSATAVPTSSHFRHFQLTPTRAALGAEVRGIDLARLDDDMFAEFYRAFLDHLVLVVRDQRLTDDDLVAIAQRFGELENPPTAKERARADHFSGRAEITVVSNVVENGVPIGELGDGELVWHCDYSFREIPAGARALYAVELPPPGKGANTCFLNLYAAFDTLPEDLRRSLAGKTIKQDNTLDTRLNLRTGAKPVDDIRLGTGPSHPIISTHPETGHNALFLGRRPKAYVNGLGLDESEALLDRLWAHATAPRLMYEHVWQTGDLVIWDNRCTLHKRGAFDPAVRRTMHGTQVKGHRHVEAADALTRRPHPRASAAAQQSGR